MRDTECGTFAIMFIVQCFSHLPCIYIFGKTLKFEWDSLSFYHSVFSFLCFMVHGQNIKIHVYDDIKQNVFTIHNFRLVNSKHTHIYTHARTKRPTFIQWKRATISISIRMGNLKLNIFISQLGKYMQHTYVYVYGSNERHKQKWINANI